MASFQAQAQDAHTLLYHDASKRSRVMPISEHMQPRRNFKHFCQCMCSSESFLGFKNTLKEYFIHCLYFGVLLLLPLEWGGGGGVGGTLVRSDENAPIRKSP